MAAAKEAVLTNGYGDVQLNGHEYDEKTLEKEDKTYNEKIYKDIPSKLITEKESEKRISPHEEQKTESTSKPKSEITSAIDLTEIPVKEEEQSGFENGPDQQLPTENYCTWEADGRVKLRLEGAQGVAAQPPISVPGMLHRTATKHPNLVALSFKSTDGAWQNVTFKEYEENVRTVAKAFIKLGLKKYHGVCIIGFNSPEWFYSDLGAIFAGGVAVGMYNTNEAEACHHILETSDANICVVEDNKQLEKILSIRKRLPQLKAIIQYKSSPSEEASKEGVLSWEEVMKLGREQDDTELNSALKKIAINECCTLVFTSGTEGKSKAVMLSHDNLTWDAYSVSKYLNLIDGGESIVSFLPLSHIAAQLADIYLPILVAAKVAFAEPDALKGSIVKTLGEVRPTVFLGVPRLWEKIHEKMMAIGAQTTGVKKMIATWGKACCLQHHMNVMNGNSSEPYRYKLYRWLVFSRVKAALGFDRTRIFLSAAAPISTDTKKYFMSIDIPVTDAFGMSECTGAHTMSKPDDFQLDTVGRGLEGTETKLAQPNDEGQGEICMRGRHVFMGYLKEPEKTQNTLDSEGWLHSGDVGTLDNREHLRITGRIKELLITAGGENIPPVLIEHDVKQELPCISNAQLIGDKRKFLSILLTLKTEVNAETGAPLDELTDDVKAWCKSLGCEVTTVSEIIKEPKKEIFDGIQAGIDRANKKAVSNAQRIQKFAILPADFSIATGELGPTLKLKRNVVYEKYSDIIENFYK